jgi:peptidoglycan/LPS O-acetylase OafA/YrhL
MSTPRPNLPLKNLRGLVIAIVLAFHSVLAYLASLPASTFPFDDPPYRWRSFPIVDNERWFGLDLFCASQDLYLITLIFFLSGLFVWRSLTRKGVRPFLRERLLRIGLPFVFAITILMPLAHYAVYRVTAVDPSIAAYWRHLLALPLWPTGPPWFLWMLLTFDLAAVALYRFVPAAGDTLAKLSARPQRLLVVLFAASALAYVPLAVGFTPWDWIEFGPFAFQISRPLHYAVYFFAGVGIGAHGIDRGLLAADGMLARRWRLWLGAAIICYLLWLGIAGLAMAKIGPPLLVDLLQALSYVAACGTSCMCALALALRFADKPMPKLDLLSDNAYGLYLVHYVFVVWLQYFLLGVAMFVIAKVLIVFSGTLLLSLAAVLAAGRVPATALLVGAEQRAVQKIQ